MRSKVIPFLPAIFAALTGVAIAIVMSPFQPGYLAYQFAMLAVALLLATPARWLWIPAVFVLLGGVFLAGFPYIPTVAVAGWVAVKQFEATPVEPAE